LTILLECIDANSVYYLGSGVLGREKHNNFSSTSFFYPNRPNNTTRVSSKVCLISHYE